MNRIFQLAMLLFSFGIAVQANAYSPSREGKHIISPMFGFMGAGHNNITDNVGGADRSTALDVSGLFGIGADYEYGLKDDFTVGGLFRYYNSSDTINTVNHQDTVVLLGGLAQAQFYNTERWNAYLGSGLTLIKATVTLGSGGGSGTYSPAMTIGLPFKLGIGYKLSDKMVLGVEHMEVMALGDKIQGWPVSDFMIRYSILL